MEFIKKIDFVQKLYIYIVFLSFSFLIIVVLLLKPSIIKKFKYEWNNIFVEELSVKIKSYDDFLSELKELNEIPFEELPYKGNKIKSKTELELNGKKIKAKLKIPGIYNDHWKHVSLYRENMHDALNLTWEILNYKEIEKSAQQLLNSKDYKLGKLILFPLRIIKNKLSN